MIIIILPNDIHALYFDIRALIGDTAHLYIMYIKKEYIGSYIYLYFFAIMWLLISFLERIVNFKSLIWLMVNFKIKMSFNFLFD